MTERAAFDPQRKDDLTKPKEHIPFSWGKGKDAARMRIIFSCESEGKNGADGDFMLRSRTIRISGASASALDKRNTGFSRLTSLVEFLKPPEPASVAERTSRIAPSFAKDARWVARAKEWWSKLEAEKDMMSVMLCITIKD